MTQPGTRDSSPGLLQDAMQELEDELHSMHNDWSGAEEEFVRRTAQVERLAAPQRLKFKEQDPNRGSRDKLTTEDLDAKVLDWLWTEHGELMEAKLNAEALCAAYRTKEKVTRAALSSKQSRLKADVQLNAVPNTRT